MIWYYLYMGLLCLTLIVWALAALRRPPREKEPEQEPTPPANAIDFRGRK
ncbi:MAG: hypothetical protein HYV26_15135 [Candidatus Hydrogenedentes bacterium]|nr:hypothetical protein [Candidatus Hydrogenedentota bacterium]